MNKKLIRITTIAASLNGLLTGQLRFMSGHYEVIGIASEGERELENIAKREGIRVIPVGMTRTISPIKDLVAMWELYKIFKKEKPFIVHTHTPKAGTVGMLAAYLARVPHRLHTVAGLPLLEAKGNKRALLNFVEKITYGAATKVYPNSFGLKQIILDHQFTTSKKLKVLGNGSSNGIDTQYFDPEQYPVPDKEKLRTSLGIQENDAVFIFVGRMVGDKGVNELVGAFSQLSKNYNNVKLMLLGSRESHLDPLLPETEAAINRHPGIISMGWQRDVRPFFAISDILTFPSYREGFPNVVLQAGAMGLPSIVTDINGCNEIIEDGKNGYIIPVKDPNSLYQKMEMFYLQNQEGSIFDKNKIRNRIVTQYNRPAIWEAILAEYDSLE